LEEGCGEDPFFKKGPPHILLFPLLFSSSLLFPSLFLFFFSLLSSLFLLFLPAALLY
jgi:hypothetical protein